MYFVFACSSNSISCFESNENVDAIFIIHLLVIPPATTAQPIRFYFNKVDSCLQRRNTMYFVSRLIHLFVCLLVNFACQAFKQETGVPELTTIYPKLSVTNIFPCNEI